LQSLPKTIIAARKSRLFTQRQAFHLRTSIKTSSVTKTFFVKHSITKSFFVKTFITKSHPPSPSHPSSPSSSSPCYASSESCFTKPFITKSFIIQSSFFMPFVAKLTSHPTQRGHTH
jgi:hypothetical protein